MTQFDDGPAKGQALSLKRACKFLRVTEAGGKFDALDMLEDSPRPEEKLYAYQISEFRGTAHIYRGRHGSGFFAMASYKIVSNQPSDAQMRDPKLWDEWCKQQPDPYPQ